MIQGVVDRNAFHIGNQYLSENRVRIVEADDSQISSAVIGNSGLYEQTIKLKDGHLVSRCSCSLPEEPMCRHCIAVLLEYHRWVQPKSQSRRAKQPATAQAAAAASEANGGGAPAAASHGGPDLKLSEVMAFIEWLQPAMKAIGEGQALPDSSRASGEVEAWIQMIRGLDERRRESEDRQSTMESERRDREAYVGRLTQQVQTSMAEMQAAQQASQQLQQEITAYQDMFAKIADLASEVAGYDTQIKVISGELLAKGAQLDKLAASFRDVAAALKTGQRSGSQSA
jgi:uncharacterized Zn finger protein